MMCTLWYIHAHTLNNYNYVIIIYFAMWCHKVQSSVKTGYRLAQRVGSLGMGF